MRSADAESTLLYASETTLLCTFIQQTNHDAHFVLYMVNVNTHCAQSDKMALGSWT